MTAITPFQFFDTIFSEALRHGQLMLRSKIRRSGKTATDWCHSLKKAARQVETYRNRREILFGVALQDFKTALARARQRNYRAAPTRVRGSEESVTALPALWAELTVGQDLDRSLARARIEAMSPPPSMLVWTGTAYQVYWLLADPWVLEDEDQRRRATRVLRKVRWALMSAAGVAGPIPGGDLAGLMRVAGTFHQLSPQETIPVAADRHPRHGGEGRWAAADFEGLEDPPPPPRSDPWSEGEGAAGNRDRTSLEGSRASRAALRPVWEGCSWLRHCYHHQATLPEGDWAAALSIVGRCQVDPAAGGASLARSFSRRHPGYLPHHADQQLERALRARSGAATCRRIGRDLGAWEGHCSYCRHQGRIEGPIVLAQRPPGEALAGPAEASSPRGEMTVVPPGGPRGEMTAVPWREVTATPGVAVEVVFRLPRADAPAAWPPLLRAAIASLERPPAPAIPGGPPDAAAAASAPEPRLLAARGESAPRSRARDFSSDQGAELQGYWWYLEIRERRAGGKDPLWARSDFHPGLLDGIDELVAALGGPATARQMVQTLAAEENRDRFDRLRSALRQLFPEAEDGLPTPRQLGYALRSCRRRRGGERAVVGAGRSPGGMTWAVRRKPIDRPTTHRKGEER